MVYFRVCETHVGCVHCTPTPGVGGSCLLLKSTRGQMFISGEIPQGGSLVASCSPDASRCSSHPRALMMPQRSGTGSSRAKKSIVTGWGMIQVKIPSHPIEKMLRRIGGLAGPHWLLK